MIEVFRTNVSEQAHAEQIVAEIHAKGEYKANFDLDDCDRVLRVRAFTGSVEIDQIIRLLEDLGYTATVLE
jgi:hypothetical protein